MKGPIFTLFFIFPALIVSRTIPSFVNLCKKLDPELSKCFNNTVYEMIPYMVKGIPEMNIPPISNVAFEKVVMNAGGGTSVSVQIELFDGTVEGIQNVDIKELEADIDAVRFSIFLHFPYAVLHANYKVKGKVLLFELDSVGHGDIKADELSFKVEFYGSRYMKKGQGHLRIDRIEIDNVQVGDITLKLEDENKEKQAFIDTVTLAINENIGSLYEELNVLIRETVASVLIGYFNRVVELFPEDQLFL